MGCVLACMLAAPLGVWLPRACLFANDVGEEGSRRKEAICGKVKGGIGESDEFTLVLSHSCVLI